MVVKITYRHQKAKCVNASLKVFYLLNFGHVWFFRSLSGCSWCTKCWKYQENWLSIFVQITASSMELFFNVTSPTLKCTGKIWICEWEQWSPCLLILVQRIVYIWSKHLVKKLYVSLNFIRTCCCYEKQCESHETKSDQMFLFTWSETGILYLVSLILSQTFWVVLSKQVTRFVPC